MNKAAKSLAKRTTNRESQESVAFRRLLHAAEWAANAMCDSINLDLAAGGDDFADIKAMNDALGELEAAIEGAGMFLREDLLAPQA